MTNYLRGILNIGAEQIDWLDRLRVEWQHVMRPDQLKGRPEPGPLIHHAPVVPQNLLLGAHVFGDRYTAINSLPKGGRIAEVGTQEGHFALHMLNMLSPKSIDLFDIDLEPARHSGSNILDAECVTAHLGKSADMLARMPDDYFDIIYLDADHTYTGVKIDAEIASRKVRPGGFIVFNDYVFWSINEFSGYGVVRACNELMIEKSFVMHYFALHPMMHCDVAIQRPI